MRAREIRKFDMLRRVQQFLNDFAAKLAAVDATAARKELDQLVEAMGVNEARQATSALKAKFETATQAVLRRDLVTHHIRPVARVAAAHLRDVPAFEVLQPPRKGIKVAELIQHTIAMAEAVRAHQQVFADNGCPANVADALLAAANAVRASIDDRAESMRAKAGARAGLSAIASRAHVILRLLDALVQSALVDDPTTLAAWNSAKRIGRGRVVHIEASRTPEVTPAA